MYVLKISMAISSVDKAEDMTGFPMVYTIQEEDIEYLRLQMHKDVDNLINAHKSEVHGTKEPRIEIIEEGFSGKNV